VDRFVTAHPVHGEEWGFGYELRDEITGEEPNVIALEKVGNVPFPHLRGE